MCEHHFCEGNFIQVNFLAITNTHFLQFLAHPTLLSVDFSHFSHNNRVNMDHFQEIFTPPDSPTPEYNPREDVLNQIRCMEDGERRDARAQQFINQFPDGQEQGAVGGHSPEVTSPVNPANPANFQIVNEYNSFNLANITPPIAPKWKQPDNLLDEFKKFKHSCLCIFDGPMCDISSGKVKTSMLLIWAGPDGKDIYDNFNLPPHQANDFDYVLQCFKEFCEPICNFRVARFKFTKVSQHQGENIDTFYNRILKLACQCDFSDMNERLIDAIIFGTTCVKAQDKLLQTPRTLSLQQCLIVCRHYKSLKLHIQQIHPGSDKHIEFLH